MRLLTLLLRVSSNENVDVKFELFNLTLPDE